MWKLSNVLFLILLPRVSHAIEKPAPEPKGTHELGLRYRVLNFPDSIVDLWLYSGGETDGLPDRPHITGHGIGLDYGFHRKHFGLVAYVGWTGSLIQEGYYDDRESDVPDYTDGDWLRAEGFGMLDLGVDFLHHVTLAEPSDALRMELILGGGLGAAFFTGTLHRWGNTTLSDGTIVASWERLEADPDLAPEGELDLPAVVPMLDLVLGSRFVINKKLSLRIEGGLHDMPYFSTTASAIF